MLQFIYGKNSYLINSELKKIEKEFLRIDPSMMNLDKLEGEDMTLSKFDQAVNAMPFLAKKRLIIIKNLLLDNKDNDLKGEIAKRLAKDSRLRGNDKGGKDEKNNKDITDIVFVETGEPDKRGKLYKLLTKIADCKLLDELQGVKLNNWISDEAKNRGVEIGQEAANRLAVELGGDAQRTINEIEKLALYAKSQDRVEIVSDDVAKLVKAEANPDIFQFVEAVARKDAATALKLWFEFMQNGENEHRMLSMVEYQFRTMIIVKDAIDRGINTKELPSLAKLHPFVVKKTLSLVRNKNLKKLIIMYDQLRRTESVIKSGSILPELAVDVLISTLCR